MIERITDKFAPLAEHAAGRPLGNDGGFAAMLKDSISEVDRLQKEADRSIERLTVGDETDIHETVIAMEKADIAFKLMVQVRNKIVGAYEEIMRMQV
jgi:flagellar hook-basal body complex protein FliE